MDLEVEVITVTGLPKRAALGAAFQSQMRHEACPSRSMGIRADLYQ